MADSQLNNQSNDPKQFKDEYKVPDLLGPPELKQYKNICEQKTHEGEDNSSQTVNIALFKTDSTYSFGSGYPNPLISPKLRHIIHHVILISLTLATAASILLLLLGVFLNCRTCLTTGCILGIACFGALLHGCLRHRSLPNSPIPVVLSAACMYPVATVPITADHTSSPAVALATATLMSPVIHRPNALINPIVNPNILPNFSNGIYIPTTSQLTANERLLLYQIQNSGLAVNKQTKSSLFSHHQCGVTESNDFSKETANNENSILEERKNLLNKSTCHSGPCLGLVPETDQQLSWDTCTQYQKLKMPLNSGFNINQNDKNISAKHNSISPTHSLEGSNVLYPVNHFTHSNTANYFGLKEQLTGIVDKQQKDTFQSQKLLTTQGQLIYPLLIPRKIENRTSFSRNCLNLFSEYECNAYQNRSNQGFNRTNRDREDIFGPRVWQSWKSWADP